MWAQLWPNKQKMIQIQNSRFTLHHFAFCSLWKFGKKTFCHVNERVYGNVNFVKSQVFIEIHIRFDASFKISWRQSSRYCHIFVVTPTTKNKVRLKNRWTCNVCAWLSASKWTHKLFSNDRKQKRDLWFSILHTSNQLKVETQNTKNMLIGEGDDDETSSDRRS